MVSSIDDAVLRRCQRAMCRLRCEPRTKSVNLFSHPAAVGSFNNTMDMSLIHSRMLVVCASCCCSYTAATLLLLLLLLDSSTGRWLLAEDT